MQFLPYRVRWGFPFGPNLCDSWLESGTSPDSCLRVEGNNIHSDSCTTQGIFIHEIHVENSLCRQDVDLWTSSQLLYDDRVQCWIPRVSDRELVVTRVATLVNKMTPPSGGYKLDAPEFSRAT